MGSLHKGHISLINKSKKFRTKVLVSIYVNPKQFNNKKDFTNYPRNFKKDIRLLKKLKVDYLYQPNKDDIFKFRTVNNVFLDKFSNKLCGKYRKGHFEGVINVVNRFLEIIKPKYIMLGEKDFQQLYLIKRHVLKNRIKTKIIPCSTIREKNGVACSSRNQRLNKEQLLIASKVFYFLKKNKNFSISKKNSIKKSLLNLGVDKVEYLEKLNMKSFKNVFTKQIKSKIFVAYYLKNIRLIDNI